MGGKMGNGVIMLTSVIFYLLGACTLTVIGSLSADVEEDLSMSAEQFQRLEEFKKMVMPHMENEKEFMKSDIYLIRWLRANNFNTKAAENMLMQNLKWRKQWKIDSIHTEVWDDMLQDFPYDYTYDFEGRPVGMLNFADWDLRKSLASGKQVRLFRYLMKLVDEISEEVFRLQRDGKNVTRWKLLINMEGFNMIQHGCVSCLPGIPFLVRAYEDHYPGFAESIITINTPSIFNVVISIAKPMLSEQNRRALKVYGFNRQQWMAELDKQISKEDRYPEFGGTKKHKNDQTTNSTKS